MPHPHACARAKQGAHVHTCMPNARAREPDSDARARQVLACVEQRPAQKRVGRRALPRSALYAPVRVGKRRHQGAPGRESIERVDRGGDCVRSVHVAGEGGGSWLLSLHRVCVGVCVCEYMYEGCVYI